MDTLVPLLDFLSTSLDKDWRDGSLCSWILEGIRSPSEEKSDVSDGLERAKKLLERHFPKSFLVEDEDPIRRSVKLCVFSAYFASVKHGWQPLKRALLKLKLPEQHLLERIFSYLLEDKWDEDLLCSLQQSVRPSSVSTTPLSRFKKASSPSSFRYSPSSGSSSSAFHPLKDFFSSPVTTQISKYQRIAEDQKRLLSLMRLELDQEKLESMNLLKERDMLSKERVALKKALALARVNLEENQAAAKEEDGNEEAAYEELQKRLAEKKDTEKYVGTLEEQLGECVDLKEELRRTVETQRAKLEERSMMNAELDSRNIQLQVSLSLEKQLNGDLSLKCNELEVQVKELQEILDSRRSSGELIAKLPRLKSNGKTGESGVSVADISMDDPMMSLPPSPEGENMAEALVIPELEEQLALTTEERDRLQEKVVCYEKELTLKIQEVSRFGDQLKEAKEVNEQIQKSLALSEKAKEEIKSSISDLQSQNSTLLKNVENLSAQLKASNESALTLDHKNEELQTQVASLTDQIVELQSSNSKAKEYLSSKLNALESSLSASNEQNTTLKKEIENFKCKESNYANEALERESKIISATEEIKTLGLKNTNLLNEIQSVSETLNSKISELSSTVDTLTSEKNQLIILNGDLKKENSDCLKELDSLKNTNAESLDEIKKIKCQNKEMCIKLESNAQVVPKLEEKIQHLESCLHKLESEKAKYSKDVEALESRVEELNAQAEASKVQSMSEIQELVNKNESLMSQLQNKSSDTEQLGSKLNALKQNFKSTEQKLLSSEKEIKDLLSANEDLKKELKVSEESKLTNLSKSEELASLSEKLKSNMNEKSAEVDRLQESLQQSQKASLDLTQKLNDSNEEREKTNNLLDSLNEELASTRKALESEVQSLKEGISLQVTEISSLNTQVQNLNKSVLEKDIEIASLNSQLATISSQELELKKGIEESERLKDSQKSTLLTLEDTLKNYESELKEKNHIIQELDGQVKEMKQNMTQLAQKKSEAEKIQEAKVNELSMMSNDFNSLQMQLKSKVEEYDTIKSSNSKIQSELDALRSSLKTAETGASGRIEELKEALSVKSKEFASVKSKLQEEVQAKASECSALETQVGLLKSDLVTLEGQLNVKSAENEGIRNECQELQSQERALVNQLKNEIETLKEDSLKMARESKSEIESLTSQVQELSGELDLKNKALHDLRKEYNELLAEKSSIEATNKQLTADIGKALNAVDKCEKEVTEINHSLPALENENRRLKEELKEALISKSSYESDLKKKEEELSSRRNKYESQLLSLEDQLACAKKDNSSEETSFKSKLSQELQKLEASLEAKSKNDLASQKKRYEARVKTITENVANQYKVKLEQFSKEKDIEVEELTQKTREFENKYKIAKVKISEMVSKLDEISKENDALQKKYNGSKNMILKLKEEKENTISSSKHSSDGSLSMEIETLKRQLAKSQTENRQLTVQFSTAELKIRSLQKEVSSLSAQQTDRPVLPACRVSPPRNNVFKIPTANDTPGRTRGGRTQSESHFHSRRPPNGVGALFNVDDEEGEMFSNSYLSDVKEGRCAVNESGRLSELSRRNTLQPSHLKSSYPIETQFYDMESFKENELKEGKVKMEIQSITKGTANLSMNSPAMNTRSRRLTIGGAPPTQLSPLSSRKRAVLDNTSFNSNSSTNSFIMRYEAKRSRKEAQQTSYSKPGPPTPAKNKSFHSNSSMNKSSTSEIAISEATTPSLRSQSPNASNRSLRSRIVDTPLTLKRAIRSTWRKKKSYNMKGGKVDNDNASSSVVALDKGRTPLKRLDKRK